MYWCCCEYFKIMLFPHGKGNYTSSILQICFIEPLDVSRSWSLNSSFPVCPTVDILNKGWDLCYWSDRHFESSKLSSSPNDVYVSVFTIQAPLVWPDNTSSLKCCWYLHTFWKLKWPFSNIIISLTSYSNGENTKSAVGDDDWSAHQKVIISSALIKLIKVLNKSITTVHCKNFSMFRLFINEKDDKDSFKGRNYFSYWVCMMRKILIEGVVRNRLFVFIALQLTKESIRCELTSNIWNVELNVVQILSFN